MTDGITGLVALFLYSQTKPEYRLISFSVLLYFIVSDLLVHHFFIDIRMANKWVLYMFYNIINLSILLRLDYLKSHNAIKVLITANILLNIPMSMYFVTIEQFQYMYNIYYYPALAIAILCLFYMKSVSSFKIPKFVVSVLLKLKLKETANWYERSINYIKSRAILMGNHNSIINYLSNRTNVFKLGEKNWNKS